MSIIYPFVAFSTLLLSLGRLRQFWHPQVLLTVMLVYMLLLDFIIRGDTDEHFDIITPANIFDYQLGILAVYLAIWGATFVQALRGIESGRQLLSNEWAIASQHQLTLLSGFATLLLLLEIVKRLSFSDWSLTTMIDNSIAPRGTAPWGYAESNVGDANFIYQVVIMLLPLSGMIYGYQMVVGNFRTRLPAFAGFMLVLALLIVDGSRTPVFLVILNLVVCYWKISKTTAYAKLPVIGALCLALVAAAAVMYEFRSVGFGLLLTQTGDIQWTLYHQDDSYYRALNAMDLAATSTERWDAGTFFYTTLVNPIPRFFWSAKPILLEEFWGNYKLEYVTISFIGELVAMFGVIVGLALSVGVGWLIYGMLWRVARLIPTPGGIIIYFLFALYGYMIFRSLYNLTMFAYLPLCALALHWMNTFRLGFWTGGSTGAPRDAARRAN